MGFVGLGWRGQVSIFIIQPWKQSTIVEEKQEYSVNNNSCDIPFEIKIKFDFLMLYFLRIKKIFHTEIL